MTMIDEQTLRDALKATADEFEVSRDGVARILDEAHVDEPENPRPRLRAFVPESRRGRVLMFSVAALVLATAIAVPLFNSETPALNVVHGELHPNSGELVVTGSGAGAINSPSSGSEYSLSNPSLG